jgi:hypothetical protein
VFPCGDVDHINGIRDDNAIANLRDVSKRVNQENLKHANSANKSCGLLGVTKCRDKWRAAITANGVARHIGVYPTPTEAHAAYLQAKRTLHAGCTI